MKEERMEPELWTRCPKATLVAVPHKRSRYRCTCHGEWDDTLLRVSFDEAVERMARELCADGMRGNPPVPCVECMADAEGLLRAALGEEKP